MAVLIQKLKEAVLDENKQPVVIHRETDTDCVIMPDGVSTLSEFLVSIGTYGTRVITLSGAVTGSVQYNTASGAPIEIDVDVTDDGHNHTGATILMPEKDRVIISSGDKTITVSGVTLAELNALAGITGNIKQLLEGKAAADHDHDTVYVKKSEAGESGGVVPLGSNGKIAEQYLPQTGPAIQIGGTQPTNQKAGDLWFQEIT